MNAIDRPLREDTDDRIDRQAAYFRELAECNMVAARVATAGIHQAHAADAETHKPTLDLSRATTAVVKAVEAENRLFHPKKTHAEPPPRAPAGDTRRAPLHHALHQATKTEPDPAARAQLRRQVNAGIEAALVADPDAKTPLCDHFIALANAFKLNIDLAKVSDEVLGITHRRYPQPGSADTGDPLQRR